MSITKHIVPILLCACAIGLHSCANRLSLEGGPVDETPPQLIVEESDENYATNFSSKKITLIFDEFVALENAYEHIIVSPPLDYPLTTVSRGKKVMVSLHPDEVLRDSTTYVIQFGDAVRDYTEGNPTTNLRYVFSTGPVIDSMLVSGQVVDDATGDPVPNVWLLAYTSEADTMLRRGKPIYFSRTDSSGYATISNMLPGDYYLYALEDKNRNYQYDLPDERIAYIDYPIPATDTVGTRPVFRLFGDLSPPRVVQAVGIDTSLVALTMAGDPSLVTLVSDGDTIQTSFLLADTLYLELPAGWSELYVSSPYLEVIDTVRSAGLTMKKNRLSVFHDLQLTHTEVVQRGDSLYMHQRWTLPITDYDTAHFHLLDTAGISMTKHLDVGQVSDTKLRLSWRTSPQVGDTLYLAPGAVTSWRATSDSIRLSYTVLSETMLSTLYVDVVDLDSMRSYIVQMVAKDGTEVYNTTIEGQLTQQLIIPSLQPLSYDLILITDVNKNGRFDGGWFDDRQRPEPKQSYPVTELRAAWDVEMKISPAPE